MWRMGARARVEDENEKNKSGLLVLPEKEFFAKVEHRWMLSIVPGRVFFPFFLGYFSTKNNDRAKGDTRRFQFYPLGEAKTSAQAGRKWTVISPYAFDCCFTMGLNRWDDKNIKINHRNACFFSSMDWSM